MNRLFLLPLVRVWLVSLLFLLPACATTEKPEFNSALKVHVNVPPSWDILLDERVSEAFVDRIREVFYRAGFTQPIEEVRSIEEPEKLPYLLSINLTEWRINRTGNIECTFTASLKTPQETRNLGVYTSTTMRWLSGPGRWGLAQAFDHAAERAIHDLCDAVAKSELLPGFRNNELYSLLRGQRQAVT